jgi:putative glutamine amidotransferase
MRPRIAIPVPHSGDAEYAERALPQYMHAVEMAGGEPVRIPLDQSSVDVMKMIGSCDGVVLPGSKADVNPAKYRAPKDPKTAPADSPRDVVDELLLQNAYAVHKPILGICYGLQILNVYHGGTLLQHIESSVNHEAGKTVPVAHTVSIDSASRLSEIIAGSGGRTEKSAPSLPVNSSHHQAAEVAGKGLRVVARCTEDGIIEALEGADPEHFVVAVQWHPERSIEEDEGSRALFRAFVNEAKARQTNLTRERTALRS